MPAQVVSAAVVGLDCAPVTVEVDIARGLPRVNIVGLPDAAVQEARDRVKAAIRNSGGVFPAARVTINLAPADLRKEGPTYDLPIALGILRASEQISSAEESDIFIGELSLNGDLRHVNGILAVAAMAREKNYRRLYLPAVNAPEASLIPGLKIIPVKSLAQLIAYLKKGVEIAPHQQTGNFDQQNSETINLSYDMSYVKGQEYAKRALEIAAAGAHNILMIGPPGSGKTLLARTLPTILPKMTIDESLEVTKVYSIAGLLRERSVITQRPFRAPHHTASGVSLVGGGAWPRPGEISLAHRGVLFLDELPEFDRQVLENLRQPLEDAVIQISRAQQTLTFPAQFALVASMNPCPCGFYGSADQECNCAPAEIARYRKRLSGPLLDRIDLHVEVPRVQYEKLADRTRAESSARIRQRVQRARLIQQRRYRSLSITTNAEIGQSEIRQFCQISREAQALLKTAVNQLRLSARGYFRVLKLARTIADLAGSDNIKTTQVAEALQYRTREERA